jgi:NADPH2 dehydrogenase
MRAGNLEPPTQIAEWKTVRAQRHSAGFHYKNMQVPDAVHAKGSFIFMQLWALARAADPEELTLEDPFLPYVSASNVQLMDRSKPPRALTLLEIKEYVALYAEAAKNPIAAGCDGVEIHSQP